MVLFVAVLVVATLGSGSWCAGSILTDHARAWWRSGRSIAPSAVLLAGVVGLAVWLRYFFVPPHHAMYVDEPWYAEAACNVARLGRLVLCEETWSGPECVPYEKAPGWPVLLSPSALLFGCKTSIGIDVNRFLGAATVLLVALATRCAGASWWQSIVPAAVLAIHPVHVAWSATGETNVAASAALLAGLSGAVSYVRMGRRCGASLAIAGLALATAIRPESLAAALAASAILAMVARAEPGRRLFVAYAIGGACTAAAAISGLALWSMNEEISAGAFLSPMHIPLNALFAVQGEWIRFPVLAGFAVLVAVAAVGRSDRCAPAWLFLAAGTSSALAALAYERFHERMLLGAVVALLPLLGLGFGSAPPATGARRIPTWRHLAAAAILLLVAFSWKEALVTAAHPPETQLLETRVAARVGRELVAARSLFITEQPTILAAAGVAHVMRTELALASDEQLSRSIGSGRPVYFLADMHCEPGFLGDAAARCGRMLQRYALTPVTEERLNDRAYVLYRVFLPGGAGPVS